MIHGSYQFDHQAAQGTILRPSEPSAPASDATKLAHQIDKLELTAEELTSAYCKIAYQKTNSFEKAAHRLQMDRRTLRKKADSARP
jgi:predicted DNA-binding protein (UPF0251 family)